MNTVSFPGLGIEAITMNATAFTIFGLEIKWYGIIITVGMILAYLYGLSRAKIERVKSDDITDLTLAVIIFGVIGARLYYILFELEDYIITDAGGFWDNFLASLKAMVNVRSGGLAIYGGIIAGAITAVVFCRIKKIRIPVIMDILAPSVMVGQIVGRWGNFVNVEAYGGETKLPWGMGIGIGGTDPYVHPTFLYESLWNLIGLILITVFYKKKKFHGQILLFYAIWYGAGRAFIEGLRTDSLMVGPIRVSQVLSAVICLAGIVLMILGVTGTPKGTRALAAVEEETTAETAESTAAEDADTEAVVEEISEESAVEKEEATQESEETADATEETESAEATEKNETTAEESKETDSAEPEEKE